MTLLHRIRRRRCLAIPLLLGLLLLRAHAPAGFMPMAGNPLQLQLCSAGMPGALAPLLHTPGHALHGEDCPFGHSPAGGPLTAVVAYAPPPLAATLAPTAAASLVPLLRPARAHRARAPPVPA